MDLAVGARKLLVAMTHCNKQGEPKILPECSLPLTAAAVVGVVVTELAVLRFIAGRLTLVRTLPGVSTSEVQANTLAQFCDRSAMLTVTGVASACYDDIDMRG